jgi:hypothetical protein
LYSISVLCLCSKPAIIQIQSFVQEYHSPNERNYGKSQEHHKYLGAVIQQQKRENEKTQNGHGKIYQPI